MDERERIRSPALVLVKVCCPRNAAVTGLIYNISRNGMFVLTKAEVKPGSCLEVEVNINGTIPLRIPGYVIHSNSHGFGFEFKHSSRALDELIRSIYPPPRGEVTRNQETGYYESRESE